jgi:hypothetical protein
LFYRRLPMHHRFDLLFDPLLVELVDAFDLRPQGSNLVFVSNLFLSLPANQTGEDVIVKSEIGAGRD